MEKKIINETHVSGRIFENAEYIFTNEERQKIIHALSHKLYPEEAVESFILQLEFNCNWLIWQNNNNVKKRIDHREKLDETIKVLEKAKGSLEELADNKFYIPFQRELDPRAGRFSPQSITSVIAAKFIVSKSIEVIDEIGSLIEACHFYHEDKKNKRGRDKSPISVFVEFAANLYNNFFGRPTNYEDGPFFKIIQICLEGSGMKFQDPSRAIRSAINTLQN